jgi:hypothetical protein
MLEHPWLENSYKNFNIPHTFAKNMIIQASFAILHVCLIYLMELDVFLVVIAHSLVPHAINGISMENS